MVEATSRSQNRETWESAAPGWAKWEQAFSAGLVSATDRLLDTAGLKPGMRVLDLACGAGNQTIRAAKRVGPTGIVVATDISPTMLEYVRQSAAEAALHNVETREGAAEELDQAQEPFDAAISRLGLMLFASPIVAVEAVRRVLKPNARFAAMCFTTPAKNPFFAQSMAVLLRHAGKPPPPPGSPGLFALGADGVLERLFRDGGLTDIETNTIRAPLRVASVSDTLEMMQDAFGAYRAVVADIGDAERKAAWADVSECLKQFEANGAFETECEFVIGSGSKAS